MMTLLRRLGVLSLIGLFGCDVVFQLREVTDTKNAAVCECTCDHVPVGLPALGISIASDDGEQPSAGGAADLFSRSLELGKDSSAIDTTVGLRFTRLGIPKNATIISATIQFISASDTSTPVLLRLAGEDADNASPFSAAADIIGRTPRTAAVDWQVNAAWTTDAAGADQRTPNLAAILQTIVNRPGWDPNNAIAILVTGVAGTPVAARRVARGFDFDPAAAPTLTVQYKEPRNSQAVPICLAEDIKQSRGGGPAPTDEQMEQDCATRVQTTLTGLAQGCQYSDACECHFQPASATHAEACTGECTSNDLATDCSNLDPTNNMTVATNAPGDPAVCSVSTVMAAHVFGRRSQCDVSGTATIVAGDENKTTGANGIVSFIGDPCPGQSCSVGMEHRIKLNNVTFGNLFGSATFSELGTLGRTVPGGDATLAADGTGVLAIGTTSSGARGRRDNGETKAFDVANTDVINTSVNWTPQAAVGCTLQGALAGSVNPELKRCENAPNDLCTSDPSVCGSADTCTGADNGDGTFVCQCLAVERTDSTVALSVSGTLANQPPKAAAGADQVVECNAAGKSKLSLDASASSDPDKNATAFRWFRGSRNGQKIGAQPRIFIEQPLGPPVDYFFRVLDAFGQAGEDSVKVSVVDTTPPIINCNTTPPNISPPAPPVSYTATATDVCDPATVPVIESHECFEIKNGSRTQPKKGCQVVLQGNKITITHGGGMNTHIQWTVRASDQSGNTSRTTCEIVVAHKD